MTHKTNKKMSQLLEKRIFACWLCLWLLFVLEVKSFKQQSERGNLTKWREHRRQKRFILFEHAGISKLVGGCVFPVDLNDKRPWRQLVMTFNIQYQFPVPPTPIYYWDKWDEDRSLQYNNNRKNAEEFTAESSVPKVDEAQMFLYEMAVELMNRRGVNGVACLQKSICENAQLHGHDGLFAEIVYRILTPHKSLDVVYLDAFNAGKKGSNCKTAFPQATNCLIEKYLHVKYEAFEDEFDTIVN